MSALAHVPPPIYILPIEGPMRHLREQRGLTQRELARLLGLCILPSGTSTTLASREARPWQATWGIMLETAEVLGYRLELRAVPIRETP